MGWGPEEEAQEEQLELEIHRGPARLAGELEFPRGQHRWMSELELLRGRAPPVGRARAPLWEAQGVRHTPRVSIRGRMKTDSY
jgi:hypothetical protein